MFETVSLSVSWTTQDAVTRLHRCVAELKIKAEFEEWCDPSKGARRRGVGSGEGGHSLHPWPDLALCDPITRWFLVLLVHLKKSCTAWRKVCGCQHITPICDQCTSCCFSFLEKFNFSTHCLFSFFLSFKKLLTRIQN